MRAKDLKQDQLKAGNTLEHEAGWGEPDLPRHAAFCPTQPKIASCIQHVWACCGTNLVFHYDLHIGTCWILEDIKLRIHLRTLVRKLHRVEEPICEHDVCVISTYKRWVPNSLLRNISIGFLMNTKDVHSSVGTMFVCSFLDSQDVEALRVRSRTKYLQVYTQLKIQFVTLC